MSMAERMETTVPISAKLSLSEPSSERLMVVTRALALLTCVKRLSSAGVWSAYESIISCLMAALRSSSVCDTTSAGRVLTE